jgi:predicted dehydrogenase
MVSEENRIFRGGLIGFGRMGITHFSILNTHPQVKFTSVCDSSRQMLKIVRKQLGLETFDDYQTMLERSQLDFVIISTPTGQHAQQVKDSIRRGLPVFVEKPFTLNQRQGQEVLELLGAKPVVNQVGYVNRYNDIFAFTRELVQRGELGELLSFRMEMHSPTVLKGGSSGWREKRSEGGGCLYDMASHGIDLINFIVGLPDKVSGSVMRSIYSRGVEDAVTTTFLYKNGLFGNLLVNWSDASFRKPTYKFEVFGRSGKIIADQHAMKVFFRDTPNRAGFHQGWNVRYITDMAKPVRFYLRGYEFTNQLDSFIDQILIPGSPQRTSFTEAFQTDRIIEMIVQDTERGNLAWTA